MSVTCMILPFLLLFPFADQGFLKKINNNVSYNYITLGSKGK